MLHDTSADWIVVGAGAAGCVLASRLSEDPASRVILLEAGRRDRWGVTRIPGALIRTLGNPRFDWRLKTEPDPTRFNRVDQWSRGRTLGGSSAINGLLFVRGVAEDYDGWAALGNTGWDWRSVLPLFRRAETALVPESQWRGQHGPTNVQHSAYRHPLTDDFIAAAGVRGLPFKEDINGEERCGVGYVQANIQRGRRHSAYDAYVRPNLSRANLQVRDNALVQRVLFEQGRATGVRVRRDGQDETLHARRGVILSLGSLMTPHLLMLSGVGPAQHLRDHGLDVVADSPELGRNFMDHPGVRLPFTVDVDTLNQQARPLRAMINGLRWLIDGKGPVGAPSAEAIGFFSCGARKAKPDLQVTLFPFANTVDARGRAVLPNRRLMNIAINLNYPESRGHLALRRGDPTGQIEIHPRLLDARKDVDTLLDGMDVARDILATHPLAAHVTAQEFPSKADGRAESEAFLRANARSFMHPIGTCRMGGDERSVVDPQLRVRGVDGLWVADASVFPTHLTGNIYASVLMVGEKAADLLKQAR